MVDERPRPELRSLIGTYIGSPLTRSSPGIHRGVSSRIRHSRRVWFSRIAENNLLCHRECEAPNLVFDVGRHPADDDFETQLEPSIGVWARKLVDGFVDVGEMIPGQRFEVIPDHSDDLVRL